MRIGRYALMIIATKSIYLDDQFPARLHHGSRRRRKWN